MSPEITLHSYVTKCATFTLNDSQLTAQHVVDTLKQLVTINSYEETSDYDLRSTKYDIELDEGSLTLCVVDTSKVFIRLETTYSHVDLPSLSQHLRDSLIQLHDAQSSSEPI